MEHKKLTVQPFHAQILGPYSNQLSLRIKSNYPLDVWVVPSLKDAELIMEGGNFRYNSLMSKQRATDFSTSGQVSTGTQVVLTNRSNNPITAEVWINY